ncbi:hypothetical protein, partial [uncultured Cobetia sp.]|uniref:hypothetical protein n=1 Tax=uncultured Cobetia sp. TaxID=410706 RepID=UPI002584FE6C
IAVWGIASSGQMPQLYRIILYDSIANQSRRAIALAGFLVSDTKQATNDTLAQAPLAACLRQYCAFKRPLQVADRPCA